VVWFAGEAAQNLPRQRGEGAEKFVDAYCVCSYVFLKRGDFGPL